MAEKTIRETIAQEVKSGYQKVSSTIVSTTRGLLDDAITGLIDDVKQVASGFFSILKGSAGILTSALSPFLSIFKGKKMPGFGGNAPSMEEKGFMVSQTKKASKQVDLLEDIRNSMVRREKKEQRQVKGKKGGILAGILTALGIVVGGIVGAIITPIGGLLSAAKKKFEVVFKIVKGVGNFFTKLLVAITRPIKQILKYGNKLLPKKIQNVFGAVSYVFDGIRATVKNKFTKIADFFSRIVRVFTKSTKGASTFFKKIPIIGNFLKGFIKGFSKMTKFIPVLGQLILIVEGVINFFKGFIKTEGTFLDKLKAGIKSAITGFFKFPVKIIGMAADWLLGLVGINLFPDEGGLTGKLTGLVDKLVNGIINWAFKPVEWLMNNFSKIFNIQLHIDKIKGVLSSIFNALSGDFTEIGNMFNNMKTWISEKLGFLFSISPIKIIKNQIEKLINFFTKDNSDKKGTKMLNDVFSWLKSLPTKIAEYVKGFIPDWAMKWFTKEDETRNGMVKEQQQKLVNLRKIREEMLKDTDPNEILNQQQKLRNDLLKNGKVDWTGIKDMSAKKVQDIMTYFEWSDKDLKKLGKIRDDKIKEMQDSIGKNTPNNVVDMAKKEKYKAEQTEREKRNKNEENVRREMEGINRNLNKLDTTQRKQTENINNMMVSQSTVQQPKDDIPDQGDVGTALVNSSIVGNPM